MKVEDTTGAVGVAVWVTVRVTVMNDMDGGDDGLMLLSFVCKK